MQLDKGNFACGIFIDLQKAFDTVNHEILLAKLSSYGIRGVCNNWFRSYLSERSQFVSLKGICSSHMKVICGVPQGSTIGPSLFLIYINDLHFIFNKGIVHHFADDTNILYSGSKFSSIQCDINFEMKKLTEWFRCNKLSINESKTEVVVFRSPNVNIPPNFIIKINKSKMMPCKYVKYVGVLIDEHLTWDYHIESVSKKLSQTVGILTKLRHYAPLKSLIAVYYALFYSHLTYGCVVWQFAREELLNRLSIIQKRCVRVITFSPQFYPDIESANPIFLSNKLLKTKDVFLYFVVTFFYKLRYDSTPSAIKVFWNYFSDDIDRSTRNFNRLRIPAVETSRFGRSSLRCKGAIIWNDFYDSLRDKSKISTLYKFKNYYRELCFSGYT